MQFNQILYGLGYLAMHVWGSSTSNSSVAPKCRSQNAIMTMSEDDLIS